MLLSTYLLFRVQSILAMLSIAFARNFIEKKTTSPASFQLLLMDQPALMSLLCEYCAHFQIQLKEGEGYRRGGTRVKCS